MSYQPLASRKLPAPGAFAGCIPEAPFDRQLEGLVDMFPHVARSLVVDVYNQAGRDMQAAIDRLLYSSTSPEAATSPSSSNTSAERVVAEPPGLDAEQLLQGLSVGAPARPVQLSALSRPSSATHSLTGGLSQSALPPVLPAAECRARGYWPDWGARLKCEEDANVGQLPPLPLSGTPNKLSFSAHSTRQGSPDKAVPNLPPLPSAAATPTSSAGNSARTPSLPAYRPPPPPRPASPPQSSRVSADGGRPAEQSLDFLQGMFPAMDAAVVQDVFLAAKDLDDAICQLMRIQVPAVCAFRCLAWQLQLSRLRLTAYAAALSCAPGHAVIIQGPSCPSFSPLHASHCTHCSGHWGAHGQRHVARIGRGGLHAGQHAQLPARLPGPGAALPHQPGGRRA